MIQQSASKCTMQFVLEKNETSIGKVFFKERPKKMPI